MGRKIFSLDSFREDELITTATAAKALRLKDSSLMTYVYNGYIPCVRDGRGTFIRVSDAKAFISGGRKKTHNHKARIGMVYSWMLDRDLSIDALVAYACLYQHRSRKNESLSESNEVIESIFPCRDRLEKALSELKVKGIISERINRNGKTVYEFIDRRGKGAKDE